MRILKRGMSETDVMKLHATLEKMGIYGGPLDGIFGETEEAVMWFQNSAGLMPDGIVGSLTFADLKPFFNGYDIYTILPGDL